MAYIPPHKRHSKDSKKPSPIPERLVPQLTRHVNLKSSKHNLDKSGNIVYADNAIFSWFIVGLDADSHFHSSLNLEPVSVESFELRWGENPLVLVKKHPAKESGEGGETISSTPSESVAANVWPDLLSSLEIVKNKKELDEGKPAMVARVGKILFHRSPSVSSESVSKDQVAENTLRWMMRTFYTNASSSYVDNIINGVVPKIGIDLEEEKDIYYITLSDNTQRGSALLCKCRKKEDKKLELYKVELNPIRQMVIDMSCVDKNLDLRLALHSKRVLTALTVKGGLRWPFGKASSVDEQYAVIGAWHTVAKKYKSPSFRLKARHVDRFDFKTAIGEATIEVVLKLKGVVSCLLEEKVERDSIFDMFKENLRMIWDHFL